MRIAKLIPITALIAAVGLGDPSSARAESPRITAPTASPYSLAMSHERDERLVRLSDDAFEGLRELLLARIAIFEGQPERATKRVKEAREELADAAKDANKLAHPRSAAGTTLIPVDARLTIAEDFVMTPEKAQKISQANELLGKGDNRQAVAVLKDAAIGVKLVTVLLPLEATRANADNAARLLAEKKYYEANLELKKVEEGLVIDERDFVEVIEAQPRKG